MRGSKCTAICNIIIIYLWSWEYVPWDFLQQHLGVDIIKIYKNII
jgi:hypothetical protein